MSTLDLSACTDLIDAIAVPIFIVEDDLKVLAVNSAARDMFGLSKEVFYRQRGGDVLHCLQAHDAPEGCGSHKLCATCVIRNSVTASLKDSMASRRYMRLRRKVDSGLQDRELRISSRPLPNAGPNVVVLTVEDAGELTQLRDILPICMMCKKVRNDKQFWQHVETYFRDAVGVDFSHGLCPECEAAYRQRQGL